MLSSMIMSFTSGVTSPKVNTDSANAEDTNCETPIFKLPIQYLDQTEIYCLNETVAADLELAEPIDISANGRSMYHYLLKPTNQFALNMIPLWKNTFTTNTDFLGETQQTILSMKKYQCNLKRPDYKPKYDTLMEIWHDTKEDPNFLERYSYMEIEMFKSFNKMPSFLQAISVINMGSPILSFFIPFMLFIIPFVILKIQGIPITFSVYISVLKEISRNHFIGKMLSNAENMSLQNGLYIIILLGLYAYQIYQNYISCMRFYKNISRINKQICDMQHYLDYTLSSMDSFISIIQNKPHYRLFMIDLIAHYEKLQKLREHISGVCPFQPSFSKIGEIGILLGCYYELYSNEEYAESLQYSFYFEGFIENLLGLYENLQSHKIGLGEFYKDSDNNTDISGNKMQGLQMKDQYYPALIDSEYIVNGVDMDKNMIITGPNAAGKTTYLKTTTLNIIFTQQFGVGFYSACKMKPYTHIHSYLNIPDTSGRDSLFQAESRRCKDIIDVIVTNSANTHRHFCIFDELYSGTNPTEASKSAYSFLYYLSKFENVDFILTTHYVDICDKLCESSVRIANWKMDAETTVQGDIKYKYTISQGISKIQGAIKVLRDMNYPEEIIQNIIAYDTLPDHAICEIASTKPVNNEELQDTSDSMIPNHSEQISIPTPVIQGKRGRKPKSTV